MDPQREDGRSCLLREVEEKNGSSSVGKRGWGRRKREILLHRPLLPPPVHGALLNPPTFLLLIPFQDTWLSLPSAPQTPVLPLLLICARPVSPH